MVIIVSVQLICLSVWLTFDMVLVSKRTKLLLSIDCPLLLERLHFKVHTIDTRVKDLFYVKNINTNILASSPINVLMLVGNKANTVFFNCSHVDKFKSCLNIK